MLSHLAVEGFMTWVSFDVVASSTFTNLLRKIFQLLLVGIIHSGTVSAAARPDTTVNLILLWHSHLGYINYQTVCTILGIGLPNNLSRNPSCIFGKYEKFPAS